MDNIKTWLETAREDFPALMNFGGKALAAFAIIILGYWVAANLRKRLRRSKFGGTHLDATLRPVLASIIFYLIVSMTIFAALVKLGVPAASLIAIFGAAGLGIGLALKDTLGNIASGIMLLSLRPVAVGDFVDIVSTSGTVKEIGLFSTTLESTEGIKIYVPNTQMWAERIQNFQRHNIRRAIIDIGVAYDCDLEQVRAGLRQVLESTPDVLIEPTAPDVFVTLFGDSAITLSCRAHLPGDNWLARTSDLRMAIKAHLDKEGVEIPFPQRVVHMRQSE